jgi:nifR3 family TIM-barrel protein
MLNEPFSLGSLVLPNRVLLSPLAGVSDVPFRRICQEMGAGLTYVEMLSAAGMPYANRKIGELIARHPAEPVLGVQMTGATPEVMAIGARILMDIALPTDTFDINMGCPVKKIVSKGCGSAIVRNPKLAGDIVRACRDTLPVPVTAKIRIGFTRGDHTVEAVCDELGRAGVAMLTIHGRTREDSYSDPVNYERIRDGFRALEAAAGGRKVWKIGNGNIFDIPSAKRMVEETGCDGILISRGSLGNPWIFRQILLDDPRQPSAAEWAEWVLRHVDHHQEFYGEGTYAAVRFRKHLLWYVAGFPGSRHLRGELGLVQSMQECRERIQRYADTLPADLPRYADQSPKPEAGHDPKAEMDREHDRGVEYYEPDSL